jgi:hypothetical protein
MTVAAAAIREPAKEPPQQPPGTGVLSRRSPQAVRARKQAVFALTIFCAVFFVGAIIVSYIVAFAHGHGTGIGDGRIVPAGTGEIKSGQGFFGDSAILVGTVAIDVALLGAWHWLVSRLDGFSDDNPMPADDGADLSLERNWYYVDSPGLLKVFVVTAWVCIAGLSLCAAAILPLALIRFGWS